MTMNQGLELIQAAFIELKEAFNNKNKEIERLKQELEYERSKNKTIIKYVKQR